MANHEFKLKTTRNFREKWEDLPVSVTVSDTKADPDILEATAKAMLEIDNATEVRWNETGSCQGHYRAHPQRYQRLQEVSNETNT